MSAPAYERVEIALGERSYPILIGPRLLDDAQLLSTHITARSLLIVTNETIAAGSNETYAYRVIFTIDDVATVGTCAAGGGLVNQAALGGSSAGQVDTCSDVPAIAISKSAGTPTPTGTPTPPPRTTPTGSARRSPRSRSGRTATRSRSTRATRSPS